MKNTELGHPILRSNYATVLEFAQAVRDWHASQNTAKEWSKPLGSERSDSDDCAYEIEAEAAMDAAYWGCDVSVI
jgi:hypothetical protein